MSDGNDLNERLSFLQSANMLQDILLPDKRLETITYAVNHLKTVTYVIVATVLTVEIVLLADVSTKYSIPPWILFMSLWLGHVAVGVVTFNSVSTVCSAFQTEGMTSISSSSDLRSTHQWHLGNDNTVPLIRYLIVNLFKTLWISTLILLVEILSYLSMLSIVPAYSCIVPVYTVAGLGLISAILWKSTSLSVIISWCFLLTTAVLLNVKIAYSSVSYAIVFIPVYMLISYWLIICTYIFMGDSREEINLKGNQFRMVSLFSLSLLLFLVASVSLQECLMNADPDFFTNIIFAVSMILLGSGFFSFWLVLYVRAGVASILLRMGAEKPRFLFKSSAGHWVTREGFNSMVGVDDVIGEIDDSPDGGEGEWSTKDNRYCGQMCADVSLYCMRRARKKGTISTVLPIFSSSSSYSRISDDTEERDSAFEPLLGTPRSLTDNS